MKSGNSFFEKRFAEKRFVNVSVCESNIKTKKGTYYGRVCNMGHINTKELLQIAKDRSPHIDIPLVESALQTIADVILDMAGQGYSVDFANLGTFSLSTQGKIEMSGEEKIKDLEQESRNSTGNSIEESSENSIEDLIEKLEEKDAMPGNYDVTEKVKNGVNFAFKFSPSKELKASMKNIKMNLAIKKKHAPLIKEVKDALPERTTPSPAYPTIVKVNGSALKIMGDDERVGIYIEEKYDESTLSPFMMKNRITTIMKVPSSSLIQNENKTLTFLFDGHLKAGKKYCITLVTQGVSGDKLGKKIRYTKTEFMWKSSVIQKI